jgi:hypothetical protein
MVAIAGSESNVSAQSGSSGRIPASAKESRWPAEPALLQWFVGTKLLIFTLNLMYIQFEVDVAPMAPSS